jgi:hypothetical protein
MVTKEHAARKIREVLAQSVMIDLNIDCWRFRESWAKHSNQNRIIRGARALRQHYEARAGARAQGNFW